MGERQKFLLVPIRSSNFSFPFRLFFPFFSFLFFHSHFSFRGFEEGVPTCHEGQRTTHPRAQRYSTSQDRADQPDLEGGYRLITKGGYLYASVSFHPYLNFYLRPFELTVPESHRLHFSRNFRYCQRTRDGPSRRDHRCAFQRFLNVFRPSPQFSYPLRKRTDRNLNFNSLS